MKLKEFNPTTCPSIRQSSALAQVGISMKVGVFNFNKPASDLIGLKDGDQVLFHQDEDEPSDWYVEKVKSDGFPVRHKENSGKGILMNNTALARKIAESVDYKGTSGKCLIAGTPTKLGKRELWGILTSRLVNV